MIIITEQRNVNATQYECIRKLTSGQVLKSVVCCRAVIIPRKNKKYYLVYNSNMEVMEEMFHFINFQMGSGTDNTKIKAHEALKFLASYEEIIGKSLVEFDLSDLTGLKYFLHGYSPQGPEMVLNLSTVRSNATVNGYLSTYRSYLKALGVTKHPLFNLEGKKRVIPNVEEPFSTLRRKYSTNDKLAKPIVEVPHYISVEDFTRILAYVRKNDLLAAEIIIRLMFQCGLRIGEVLGLTNDDLIETTANGHTAYVAQLRNRVSDNIDQCAKTCMKVVSTKQYISNDYQLEGYGYQEVPVPLDLYELLCEYIEDVHVKARKGKRTGKRYYEKSLADRVRPAEEYEDDNFYIFINSIGTPLSASSWNNTLREIFRAVDIPIDVNVRKDGLNHRFRHGFAMFHVMYLHVQPIELAKLLRHSNIDTVMKYYRPTRSDQIALKTAFAESLYEIVPELRREE